MLFSSTVFIYLFLPAVLIGYYVLFRKNRALQNIFLLLASLLFYAWGEPKFVLVMMGSIALNWILGLFVDKFKAQGKINATKGVIAITCIANIGMLFIYKYLNFASDIVCDILKVDSIVPEIALPIGISFFTFQAMSYVIDVYRGKGEVQKNILNVGLYIAFFPQLIAGPIVRYETVAYEIKYRKETWGDFFDGFARFLIGVAKKVILANSFAVLADTAFNSCSAGETLSVTFSWLGAIAYTFQIFFDFGGYSDMAIGLGKMFGFHFLENFDYPYISKSISEFWRRWHMSLGTWFRDYVYFPLGGSRVNKPRLIFNLFVTWMLTGIWHGANWTFFVWGFMYFVLLTVEKLTGMDKKQGKVINVFKWIYTMIFVVIGWVIFRAESMGDALIYLASMFGVNHNTFTDGMFSGYFTQNLVLLIAGAIASTPIFKYMKSKFNKSNVISSAVYVVVMILLFMICVSSLVSNSYNPFIYFNF